MWSSILPLILFVCLGIAILIIFEVRARKEKNNTELLNKAEQATDVATEERSEDDGCCGEHLVCERETLLQTNAQIEYFDDEELDALIGIAAEDYTPEQYQMIREVFETLKASDVPGWVRSIQLRNIQLPLDIREEALLIVVERRKA
jgi:hypothetical protein